ncbi:MAG: hypothetical protein HY531_02805 [Chloroflexi bacterium]|nr:hypothetical protein [Chloroflexota bacterium]
MAKAAKKTPPSRVRYEAANPTVSCRVPREIYERLEKVKQVESRSFADVLKIGLGILEVRAKAEEEIRRRSHGEGHKKGYAEAERTFKVTYPCQVCRKTITVTSTKEKEAIQQYMQEHGWGHAECIKGSR